MARAIPTYNRQFLANDVQSAPKASTSVSASSPVGEGLQNVGNSLGNLGQVMQADAKKKADDRAAVDVANVLSQGEVYWQQNFTERAKAWRPGAEDMRDGIGKDFDKWVSENEQKLPTEASKKFFQQHAIKLRTSMQTNAYSFQEKSTTDKMNADTAVGEQADENSVFSDPSRMEDVYRRRTETMLARTDLSDADKIKQADLFKRKLSLAAERGQMERDPQAWYRARFGEPKLQGVKAPAEAGAPSTAPAAGFDGVMKEIFKTEGGYNGSDGNTNAPVNFGINQKANPDIDVKNLTKERAAKIYKARYWDKIGGDSLPPGLQGTAMDAAVNQGPENAKKWIRESGGDPAKFNDLRRAHYEALLKKPENARFRSAWMGRLDKYASAGAGQGEGDAVAPGAPKSFAALDWEQRSALRAQADARIKQDDTRVVANVTMKAADTAVMGQNIGNDLSVDLGRAKTEAIAAATKQLGRQLDEVQQQQIESAVERSAGARERDRKRGQDNIAQSVFDELDKNGGDYQAVRGAMPAELDKLPREVQQRAQKYAGQVATGETRETDWIAYSSLVDNPKMLAETNLSALKDKFGASEFAQLVKLQEAGKKNASGAPDQTILGDMAVVKGLLKEAGISSKTKEAQFFSVLQREMDARRGNDPKAPPLKQAEVKAIAADLLTREIIHKGVLWDTKDHAFQIEVPAPERAKITAALNEAGMPVNDSTILRAYRNKLNKAPVPAATPAPPAPPTQSASGTIKY